MDVFMTLADFPLATASAAGQWGIWSLLRYCGYYAAFCLKLQNENNISESGFTGIVEAVPFCAVIGGQNPKRHVL
jgi:hypothetical protein